MNKPLATYGQGSDYRARFTTAEFLEMVGSGVFDDMRIELVEGELERMNPAMSEHGRWQTEVGYQLRSALGPEAKARLFGEIGITLKEGTVRAADFALVHEAFSEKRMLRPQEILLLGEIADDTLARDLGDKTRDYALAEIQTYWVIDVNGRVVHVMTDPAEGEYHTRESCASANRLPCPAATRRSRSTDALLHPVFRRLAAWRLSILGRAGDAKRAASQGNRASAARA